MSGAEVDAVELDWHGRPLRLEIAWVGAPESTCPPVVFLHEGLGSVAMWKDFPARFCAAHGLRGLVWSRAGYGRSTPRPHAERWPPSFLHAQAHEVLPALLERLAAVAPDVERPALRRPWLFGHSDGASIALLHAARFDVVGVVAVAPHLFVEPLSIASIEQVRADYRTTDLPSRLARYHDDVDSAFYGWNDVWLDPAFRAWNIEAELESIRCPVLAVQGTEDAYGTLAQIERLQHRVPQTELRVLPGCGHSPHRDRPDALSDAAGTFIRRHSVRH